MLQVLAGNVNFRWDRKMQSFLRYRDLTELQQQTGIRWKS